MNYIVMDLEWNHPLVPKKRVRGLNGEIVQIGAIKVDENLNELGTFNEIVKPFYYRKINKEVSDLTGITQDMLDNATLTFENAIKKFREWMGEDSVFVTWSFSDISMILNNLEMYDMDTGWLPENYNAQWLFDDQEMQEGRDFALNYALYYFNEKPEAAHDALDDSRSTLKILRHLDLADLFTEEYAYFNDENNEEI